MYILHKSSCAKLFICVLSGTRQGCKKQLSLKNRNNISAQQPAFLSTGIREWNPAAALRLSPGKGPRPREAAPTSHRPRSSSRADSAGATWALPSPAAPWPASRCTPATNVDKITNKSAPIWNVPRVAPRLAAATPFERARSLAALILISSCPPFLPPAEHCSRWEERAPPPPYWLAAPLRLCLE